MVDDFISKSSLNYFDNQVLPAPDLTNSGTTKHQQEMWNDEVLLMCKNTPVYNVTSDLILNNDLLPGSLKRGTMNYDSWMSSRYSARSNVLARRLLMRAAGTDSHGKVLKATYALSLSDCYWLKEKNSKVMFEDITPYLHKEWNGEGTFMGGSISTLFVNGAASKCWVDSKTLKKISSVKEMEVYELCYALGIKSIARSRLEGKDLLVENFTSVDFFFESLEQSGFVAAEENHLIKWIEIFKEHAVALFVIDYLCECDDRHSGNIGFIRNSDTGEYASMAPYFDFDWCWTDGVVKLPDIAFEKYGRFIQELCEKAESVAHSFEHGSIITKRAEELLLLVRNQ